MQYFTEEFNDFFKELAANNSKSWFNENRKRYEKLVKEPFKQLVTDVIDEINTFDSLDLEPKKAIIRINNDIRFSKNKPLYKLHVGAAIGDEGTKNFGKPKMYFQLSPGESFIADGVYMPNSGQLQKIREHISKNLKKFKALYTDKDFQKAYGSFSPAKVHKRIPKEFQKNAEKEPLLYNKQFFYVHNFPNAEKWVTKNKLKEEIIQHYKIGSSMRDFFNKALE